MKYPQYHDKAYVWYASYGSNLLRDRFYSYIIGGPPHPESEKIHTGCTDKALPTNDLPIDLDRKLSFRGTRSHWGPGGVAFIADSPTDRNAEFLESTFPRLDQWIKNRPKVQRPWACHGRMYRITQEQFLEVVAQENNQETPPQVDWNLLSSSGSYTLTDPAYKSGWYDKILQIGSTSTGEAILTFTTSKWAELDENPPSPTYLRTISLGIRETLPNINSNIIRDYFVEAIHGGESGLVDGVLLDLPERIPEQGELAVAPTLVRDNSNDEFICQLTYADRKRLSVSQGDRVVISRKVDRRQIQVVGIVNCSDVPREGTILMDQKLRVAIGSPVSSTVIAQKAAALSTAQVIRRFIEKLLGSQPELMRVGIATFEDMEIDICRIPTEVFDIIGIKPGDYVTIEAVCNRIQLRTATLTQQQRDLRDRQLIAEASTCPPKRYYPDMHSILDLRLVVGGTQRHDHPMIFLDKQTRDILRIEPGSCVRVSRDASRALWSRLYFITIPTSFVSIQLVGKKLSGSTYSWLDIIILIAIMLAVSIIAVLFELRKRIS